TAALLALAKWNYLHPLNGFEQHYRRLAAVCPPTVTRPVKGDFSRKPPGPGTNPKTVDDIIRDLPRPPRHSFHSRPVRLFLELQRRAVKQHRRARTGWDDHRPVARKGFDTMANNPPRGVPVTRVKGRLTAAGLTFREGDVTFEVLQHLDRGDRHIVKKRVAEAGRHQLYAPPGGNRPIHWCHEPQRRFQAISLQLLFPQVQSGFPNPSPGPIFFTQP